MTSSAIVKASDLEALMNYNANIIKNKQIYETYDNS